MTLMQWNPAREAMSLRHALDRLMEDAFIHPGRGGEGGVGSGLSMPLDVKEREDELVVRASLPGVKPEDVDITFEENVLTIQGELHDEDDEGDRPQAGQATAAREGEGTHRPTNGQRGAAERTAAEQPGRGRGQARYHQREHVYGRFFRQVRLPIPVNAEQAQAKFEHGVLTITLPKAEQAKRRRIEVTSQGGRRQVAGGSQGMSEQTERNRAPKQRSR